MLYFLFILFTLLHFSSAEECPEGSDTGGPESPDGCAPGQTSNGKGWCCGRLIDSQCLHGKPMGPDTLGCPKDAFPNGKGFCCPLPPLFNAAAVAVADPAPPAQAPEPCPNGLASTGSSANGCREGTYFYANQCCISITCPNGKFAEGPSIVGCPKNYSDYKGDCCETSTIPVPGCPIERQAGPDISGCPEGSVSNGGVCCREEELTTTTASVKTTRMATKCVDKVNPRTGVSDCPQRLSLCQDANYRSLMAKECPKTCGLCGGSSSNSSCSDLRNPQTGISDCPSLKHLCKHSNYISIMKVQCQKTCGFCAGSTVGGGSSTSPEVTVECKDVVNKATGVSDCPRRKNLCSNPTYVPLMRTHCPFTCGFC